MMQPGRPLVPPSVSVLLFWGYKDELVYGYEPSVVTSFKGRSLVSGCKWILWLTSVFIPHEVTILLCTAITHKRLNPRKIQMGKYFLQHWFSSCHRKYGKYKVLIFTAGEQNAKSAMNEEAVGSQNLVWCQVQKIDGKYFLICDWPWLGYLENCIDCCLLAHCWSLIIQARTCMYCITIWAPAAHIIFLKVPHIKFYLGQWSP
jgi:hypothetical protein